MNISDNDLPEHARENRRYWDGMADQWVASGERLWHTEPQWSQSGIPNAEAPLLPDSPYLDRTGHD